MTTLRNTALDIDIEKAKLGVARWFQISLYISDSRARINTKFPRFYLKSVIQNLQRNFPQKEQLM